MTGCRQTTPRPKKMPDRLPPSKGLPAGCGCRHRAGRPGQRHQLRKEIHRRWPARLTERQLPLAEKPTGSPCGGTERIVRKKTPHTVNQAIAMIFEQTGVRLKHTACQTFLKKIGMKCRRCGLMPGKALDDAKHRQALQEFHDNQLQPRLDEAKQGQRTVLFVDAAHFVMGAFLGMV